MEVVGAGPGRLPLLPGVVLTAVTISMVTTSTITVEEGEGVDIGDERGSIREDLPGETGTSESPAHCIYVIKHFMCTYLHSNHVCAWFF